MENFGELKINAIFTFVLFIYGECTMKKINEHEALIMADTLKGKIIHMNYNDPVIPFVQSKKS